MHNRHKQFYDMLFSKEKKLMYLSQNFQSLWLANNIIV